MSDNIPYVNQAKTPKGILWEGLKENRPYIMHKYYVNQGGTMEPEREKISEYVSTLTDKEKRLFWNELTKWKARRATDAKALDYAIEKLTELKKEGGEYA